MNPDKSLGLYLHIPFCVQKCRYCDFLSFPTGSLTEKTGTKDTRIQPYVERLCREIRERGKSCGGYVVDTLFFGGGTPSLLTGAQMGQIMTHIRESFRMSEDAECSMECNPGTATLDSLKAYHEAGINRLSIGLQSSCDKELQRLGRIHNRKQFEECFRWARRAGFENVNIDLMSALPGQTRESYAQTLRFVAGHEPEHISAYSLILEEGTPLYQEHPVLPDEDTDRLMYEDTKRILTGYGYHRYEISNYAKKGRECRHNCKYWTRGEYLGMGLGASSQMEHTRFQNVTELESYMETADPAPAESRTVLSQKDEMEEFMFLGLRLTEGIKEETFRQYFGSELDEIYGTVLKKLEKEKLLRREKGSLRLTDYGTDISNYVLAQFLLDEL